jgi:membrane-associated PAP2 superfamily phosphatase
MNARTHSHKRLLLIGTLFTLCALAWDASGLDMPVMHQWGNAQGFALKHDALLETWLHDRIRGVLWLAYLLLAWMAWRPLGPWKALPPRQRWAVWVGITVALVATTLLKRQSLTSCPWDLSDFGGSATYISHWQFGISDGGPGRCFPGGHASGALAFLAVVFPWLGVHNERPRKRAWGALIAVLAFGSVLGAVQTLRGAHFPSHTLWTAVACWFSAWAVWYWMAVRPIQLPATNPNSHAGAGTPPYP